MNSRVLLLLIIFLLNGILSLSAQTVEINLKTNNPGSIVRLIQFDDLLSRHGETIFQDTADERGMLRMNAKINKITPVHLAVDLDRVDLVLKPDAGYTLEIHTELQQKDLSYFDKIPPALLVKKATDDGLQLQLESIDRLVNDFVMDNFQELFRLKKYSLLDSLKMRLDQLIDSNALEYSQQYARYKFAAIVLAVQRDGKNRVINDFFTGQEVLYSNEAYMSLFTEIFSDYLLSNRNLAVESLRQMPRNGYLAWRDYLRNDPLLSEDNRLNELIVLASLKYLFRDSRFIGNEVQAYLNYLKQNALYAEHRQMAANIIEDFLFLAPGTIAADFELKDQSGKLVRLKDFNETIVLLQFVDENCRTCAVSFLQLSELKNELLNIQLVTIATSESFEGFKNEFASQNYDWPLLNLDKNILLLEAFNVKTFPELILINRDNKIGIAPVSQEKDAIFYHVSRLRRN